MKYPTVTGIATIRGEHKMSSEYYVAALKGFTTHAAITAEVPPRDEPTRGTPTEELELVPLLSPDRQFSIGTKLRAETRMKLVNFLRANATYLHECMRTCQGSTRAS